MLAKRQFTLSSSGRILKANLKKSELIEVIQFSFVNLSFFF